MNTTIYPIFFTCYLQVASLPIKTMLWRIYNTSIQHTCIHTETHFLCVFPGICRAITHEENYLGVEVILIYLLFLYLVTKKKKAAG